jgi:hypothetical protein
MPAMLDHLKLISDAREVLPDDPDEHLARAHRPSLRSRLVARLGSWLAVGSREDDVTTPVLRDYPWRSGDRS